MGKVKDQPRCPATHNPGVWPYVARCVRWDRLPHDRHRDKDGNEWVAPVEPEEE